MRSYYKELCLVGLIAVVAFGASWGAHVLWTNAHLAQMRDPDQWMRKYVSFTREQEDRFAKIEAQFEPQEQRFLANIRDANAALGAAIITDGEYSPRVSAAIDAVQQAQRRFQHAELQQFFALQQPLTPEQRQTLNRKAAEALTKND